MTLKEWTAEYVFHYENSPEGKKAAMVEELSADLELSDEEWWAKHGTSGN